MFKEVVGQVLDEADQKKADKLMNTMLVMATKLTLQKHMNKGLAEALKDEKKRRKRGTKASFEKWQDSSQTTTTL
jgi:hypothetical protein